MHLLCQNYLPLLEDGLDSQAFSFCLVGCDFRSKIASSLRPFILVLSLARFEKLVALIFAGVAQRRQEISQLRSGWQRA
ncbi:MAG: hypothetical protein ABSC01_07810 [Verrucomicrobiota bacterium]|jgi:hypothetical protein